MSYIFSEDDKYYVVEFENLVGVSPRKDALMSMAMSFDPENSLGSTEDQVTSETPAQIVGLKSISAGLDDEFEDDNSESLGELFQKSNDLNHSFTSNTSTISSSTATSSLPSTEEMRRIVESNKIRLIEGCCDLKDLTIGNIYL